LRVKLEDARFADNLGLLLDHLDTDGAIERAAAMQGNAESAIGFIEREPGGGAHQGAAVASLEFNGKSQFFRPLFQRPDKRFQLLLVG